MLSFHLILCVPRGLFPLGIPIKTLYAPPFTPYMLHAPSILSSLILSPEYYLVRSTNHEAFRYAVSFHFPARLRLKCDGTDAETGFRLSAKRTSPFKSAGASVQSTSGSRVVRISVSNAGYTMFRGSVKGTRYPFRWPVSPSLPLPCVTVCHHVSTGLYLVPLRPMYLPQHLILGHTQYERSNFTLNDEMINGY